MSLERTILATRPSWFGIRNVSQRQAARGWRGFSSARRASSAVPGDVGYRPPRSSSCDACEQEVRLAGQREPATRGARATDVAEAAIVFRQSALERARPDARDLADRAREHASIQAHATHRRDLRARGFASSPSSRGACVDIQAMSPTCRAWRRDRRARAAAADRRARGRLPRVASTSVRSSRSVDPESCASRSAGRCPTRRPTPARSSSSSPPPPSPASSRSPSGRYFGFVIGGALPAALAADWLTSTWDQNAGLYVGGPSASVVEEVAREWLVELLGLPRDASIGFVTGCQMAHVTALAAARFHVLAAAGWDVEPRRPDRRAARPRARRREAPRHRRPRAAAARPRRAGGRSPPTTQGRMRRRRAARRARRATGPTIVCAQAGEVNTGAFDPLREIADAAEAARRLAPRRRRLRALGRRRARASRTSSRGAERADSWATDAHKWLNVPYDSGIVALRAPRGAPRGDDDHARLPDPGRGRAACATRSTGCRSSRAARAASPSTRRCARSAAAGSPSSSSAAARRRALRRGHRRAARRRGPQRRRAQPGALPLRDATSAPTRCSRACRTSGDVWMSGTTWDGRKAIRLSVSNWQTGDEEIDLARRRRSATRSTPARRRRGRR